MTKKELKKELLDKWYSKRFRFNGGIHTCVGVDFEDIIDVGVDFEDIIDPLLIFWSEIEKEYMAVGIDQVEEVKEPRVIYVNEYEDGLGPVIHLTEDDAKKGTGAFKIRTIKFKECVEE